MSRLTRSVPIAVLLALACVLPAVAQDDVKGSADHPVFPKRMDGYYISLYRVSEFDAVKFATTNGPVTVEGKVTRINYRRPREVTHPGGLAIRRNYENAAVEAGGEVVGRSSRTVVLKLTAKDGAEVWAEVEASESASATLYQLTVLERAAMAQQITANAMAAALGKEGFVTLYINFATGQSAILGDSMSVVDQLAEALRSAPGLRVSVEGHTDDVGEADANQALSEARAAAVVSALRAKGIAADRLQSRGWGETKPLAPNASDAARAKNRRVEIVRIP